MGVSCPLQGPCAGTGFPCATTRFPGLAVPPVPARRAAGAGRGRGRRGGMARQGGPAPLFGACSFVCRSWSVAASLPGWAGWEGTGDTGDRGWVRGAGDAEQQVPMSPGCCRQPRRFPVLALPFLSLKLFFSRQEEFEASRQAAACRQEQAGLCRWCCGALAGRCQAQPPANTQSQSWAPQGAGDGLQGGGCEMGCGGLHAGPGMAYGVSSTWGLGGGICVLWGLCTRLCLSFPCLCSSQPAWAQSESLLLECFARPGDDATLQRESHHLSFLVSSPRAAPSLLGCPQPRTTHCLVCP